MLITCGIPIYNKFAITCIQRYNTVIKNLKEYLMNILNYPVALMTYIGVQPSTVKAMFADVTAFTNNCDTNKLAIGYHGTYIDLGIGSNVLNLIMAGKLGPKSLAMVQSTVISALKSLYYGGSLPTATPLFEAFELIDFTINPKAVMLAKKHYKEAKKPHPNSYMYTPTKGTSTGSIYFVVGMGEIEDTPVTLAARFKNGKLSVRVETDFNDTTLFNTAEAVGLSVKDKEYASLHVDTDSVTRADMVLGAIILGMGITLHTELPTTTTIKGKGL